MTLPNSLGAVGPADDQERTMTRTMTLTKTGLARMVLATGILLLSGTAMAAAPARKDAPPAEKSAPAPMAPNTATPAPVVPGPATGPAVATRKGRGHF